MINELGSSKSNMDLHEDYKLIENSDYTGLIYSSKYRVQKILLNISDKYTFICKVDIKRNDKQFIIVIVYAPPNEFNEISNNNIIAILKTIKSRFINPSIICFEDLNIPRNTFNRMYKALLNNDFDFHIKEGEFNVTHCRFLKSKKLEYNYIDYMITSNVIVSNFEIKKPPGISEHFF